MGSAPSRASAATVVVPTTDARSTEIAPAAARGPHRVPPLPTTLPSAVARRPSQPSPPPVSTPGALALIREETEAPSVILLGQDADLLRLDELLSHLQRVGVPARLYQTTTVFSPRHIAIALLAATKKPAPHKDKALQKKLTAADASCSALLVVRPQSLPLPRNGSWLAQLLTASTTLSYLHSPQDCLIAVVDLLLQQGVELQVGSNLLSRRSPLANQALLLLRRLDPLTATSPDTLRALALDLIDLTATNQACAQLLVQWDALHGLARLFAVEAAAAKAFSQEGARDLASAAVYLATVATPTPHLAADSILAAQRIIALCHHSRDRTLAGHLHVLAVLLLRPAFAFPDVARQATATLLSLLQGNPSLAVEALYTLLDVLQEALDPCDAQEREGLLSSQLCKALQSAAGSGDSEIAVAWQTLRSLLPPR